MRVRGGYFSTVQHVGHPSVTFGDSSPQGELFFFIYTHKAASLSVRMMRPSGAVSAV